MQSPHNSYYIINGVTMYRLVSAPFLVLLAIMGLYEWFKWFMCVSFFTDAIDGPLSRKYEVESVFGARLDSVADDATVLASAIALWILHPEFMRNHWIVIAGLSALFGIQAVAALIAYKKVTSFHTYMAKAAAVAQAAFFIVFFFRSNFADFLFVCAVTITALQLVEEIILVIILPTWTADVKGIYWIWRSKSHTAYSKHSGIDV
jgi:phosphatidylglycerophosphate synthase